MAFPSDHRWPVALPAFRLLEHELAAGERVEVAAYEAGEDRHREQFSATPWLARVATRLTQAQYDVFAAWYEGELEAGARPFDVQVQSMEGEGPEWWAAMFVEPFRNAVASGYRHAVTAQLLLLDGPYATRTAPTMRARAASEGASIVFAPPTGELMGRATGEGEMTLEAPVPVLYARSPGEGDATGFPGPAPSDATVDALARVGMGAGFMRAGIADSADALAAQTLRG